MDAVVMGGTGLVGRALLDALAADPPWKEVHALVRRVPEGLPPGVRPRVVDPARLAPEDVPEGCDAAFCALGTTIRKAGSQEAFRAVDHGLVLRFAQACRARGVASFHVVTAMGADPASRVFYNRVKGEAERDLRAAGFPRLCVYRPSLLLGEREERRPAERAGIAAARLLAPVIPRRWRGIEAATVARAMARHAKEPAQGVHVHPSDELARMGARAYGSMGPTMR